MKSILLGLGLVLPVVAVAQQPVPNWQDIALRAQQNATVDKVIDNSMLAALQAEIADLKAQLAKKQTLPDPPSEPKSEPPK